MTKNKLTIGCSDWMRGWGYGHNHIGKLSIDPATGVFTWKGYQQGRHGQQWNKGMKVVFTYNEGGAIDIIFKNKDYASLPYREDVIEAANILLSNLKQHTL